MQFKRFGIYFTPPPGPFADAGARWLGWDAAAGACSDPAIIADLPLPWDDITRTPRKYGFHATIKPPFRLAPGVDFADLQSACAAYCENRAPVTIEGLAVKPLGRFLALIPEGDTKGIDALAAASVMAFDRFRAPINEAELARRRAPGLTPSQETMLIKWGYPHVIDGFQFHMTLTGKLPKAALPAVKAALEAHVVPHVPRPLRIDALSLMGEDDTGRFHLLHRMPLEG